MIVNARPGSGNLLRTKAVTGWSPIAFLLPPNESPQQRRRRRCTFLRLVYPRPVDPLRRLGDDRIDDYERSQPHPSKFTAISDEIMCYRKGVRPTQ